MIPRLALAGFVLAHAAIHLGFVSPRPPDSGTGGPAWPFELGRSWILSPLGVDPGIVRMLGLALVVATVGGLALAALAALGVAPALWAPGVVVGTAASIAVLVLFFHPWLVLGLAIDAAFLWLALAQQWSPEALTS
jgi:hypothetical protein